MAKLTLDHAPRGAAQSRRLHVDDIGAFSRYGGEAVVGQEVVRYSAVDEQARLLILSTPFRYFHRAGSEVVPKTAEMTGRKQPIGSGIRKTKPTKRKVNSDG